MNGGHAGGMKIVYIAGPYNGPDYHRIEENIGQARKAAAFLAENGIGFFCPHLNSAHFEVITPNVGEAYWREMDLKFLPMCDAMLMLDRWEESSGADTERYEFEVRFPDRPVFYWETNYELLHWAQAAAPDQSAEAHP